MAHLRAGHLKLGVPKAATLWPLTFDHPGLVKPFNLQVHIMDNFGLNGEVLMETFAKIGSRDPFFFNPVIFWHCFSS